MTTKDLKNFFEILQRESEGVILELPLHNCLKLWAEKTDYACIEILIADENGDYDTLRDLVFGETEKNIKEVNNLVRMIRRRFKLHRNKEHFEELSDSEFTCLIIAYDNYKKEFEEDEDRVGQEPVCIEEFYDNEFQEEEIRAEYLK